MSAITANAADLGLRLQRLAPWYDVDDTTGLRRLRRDLDGAHGAAAPCTAAALRRVAPLRRP
jgi:hypothetical protein